MLQIRDSRADGWSALEQLLRNMAIFEPHEISVAEALIALALSDTCDYLVRVGEDTAAGDEAASGRPRPSATPVPVTIL